MPSNSVLQLMKKVSTKKVEINGGEIEVKELTVNQVNAFMVIAEALEKEENFENSKKSLIAIVQSGVVGMEEVKDKDFDDMPIATLKEVSEAVLVYNGLNVETVNDPNVSAVQS